MEIIGEVSPRASYRMEPSPGEGWSQRCARARHRFRSTMANDRDIPRGVLAGTPQNGAVEIEQNRLTGKTALGGRCQRALRGLAEQLEEFGPRRFLFNPTEHLAGQRCAPNFFEEQWRQPRPCPHLG